VAFINATVEEKQLDELLKNNGYQKVLDMPLCYLDVCWNSFKEYGAYLKSVSKNIWTSVKREINKNKKEGVLIRQLEAVDGCEDRLHELVNMNINTHNALPYLFSRDFYRKLKENFGKEAAIYVAFKDDLISAVSISISHGSVSALIVVGVDHKLSGKDCTYFNIAYYRPITDALSSGITRINYGRGMYELKRRRGCKVKNIFFYYKPYTLKQKMMAKFLLPLRGWWVKKMLPKNIKESLLKEIGGSA
jgi:predicted N-acyltransferase